MVLETYFRALVLPEEEIYFKLAYEVTEKQMEK